jgi:RNA recognition motif-containing protein
MGRRLYVGNLPFKTTNEDLGTLFAQAGPVEDVQVMRDLATGRARGFAFVQMATDEAAQKAISEFHQYSLEGRPLVVNEARPRTPGAPGGAGDGAARGGAPQSARPPRW